MLDTPLKVDGSARYGIDVRLPERRRLVERGIELLGQAHVDAVARTAVHLEWGIESPHGGADQAEIPGIGEFDVVRHREPGGGLGARAEARALAGRGDHEAVLHAADGGPRSEEHTSELQSPDHLVS